MRRKPMFLLLALAATAAFGAGAWGLARAQETQQSALEDVETVRAAALSGDVTDLAYNTSGGVLVHLTQTDGMWALADNAAFPLTQSYAQSMASLASNVGATALVREECDDLAEYGLDAPQKTIEAGTASGESLTLFVGDRNTHTDDYYLRVDGSSAVYTVDATFFASFNRTPEEMAQLETWPASQAQEVTGLSVEGADADYRIAAREETVTDEDGSEQTQTVCTFTDDAGSFDTTDLALPVLLSEAAEIEFQSLDVFQPDGDALAARALDENAVRMTVTYTDSDGAEAQAVLLIGLLSDGGERYVRMEGSDCVYLADADLIGEFLNFSRDSVLESAP